VKQLMNWFDKRFADPELAILLISLALIVIIFHFAGGMLAPVLVSIVIAYLLDGMVERLVYWRVPNTLAVSIVCVVFIGLLLWALIVLLPLLWQQATNLFNELPVMVKKGESLMLVLSQRFPDFISTQHLQNFIAGFQQDLSRMGKILLSYSLSTLTNMAMVVVYLVLVPLMVFFFMKDKTELMQWFAKFLPQKRRLMNEVWSEVNQQIAAYIRAKVLEMVIVGVVSTTVFLIFGLNYAILLGVLLGLSTLIPYVGVIVVTIPVAIIAFLQWGMQMDFLYLMIGYTIIMILDGNLLAPLLFSEALKIHPVAVIIAVIFFGSIWGFWGIFFAIPLATVVKAVLNVWLETGQKELA